MKVFPPNWITMSGPSSAKAGMQGNSDSSNGSNCIYGTPFNLPNFWSYPLNVYVLDSRRLFQTR